MVDFFRIATKSSKRGVVEIYPKFIIKKSSDLMIRGGDFYAVWVEDRNLWSTDEMDALYLIDRELDLYAEKHRGEIESAVKVMHMWDAESGMIDNWHKYCKQQMRDNFQMLDEKIIFSNYETSKKDYASKKLNYPLEDGERAAYDKLMSTLYSEEERKKIEWAIGAIVSGDSKNIQKFMVLYGAAGTGKSTVLNIIQKLFEGYFAVFDAKSLGSPSSAFALEAFRTNPLVAIQHDGDLSRIEDNTRLNSLVSHEIMTVNEKFKSTYANRFKCFLFMGTNKPVRITDAKSGLIRRLIDVSPSGNKLPTKEYLSIMKKIDFELGAIAYHCQEVYLSDPNAYNDYIPLTMLGASNDFYNFVSDSYFTFKKRNCTSLKVAWEMYKTYCDDAKVQYPFSQRVFKEELKNYFDEYHERYRLEDGTRLRSFYTGFKTEKFEQYEPIKEAPAEKPLIQFEAIPSIFDSTCGDCMAQYANSEGVPLKKWNNVKTKLSELDTSKLHYVKLPENHIVIDFDIPDKDGNKDFHKNLERASEWPPTYAELSKSGSGIHLHYIYSGDPTKLSRIYDDHIEIKVFTGNSSLRRKLSKCNNLPISTINAGLPLKGEKMINQDVVMTENGIRTLIKRNLNKEYHPGTKPSIDFIYKILEEAYEKNIRYDVTDLRNAVLAFAASSTHHSEYCIGIVNKMQFKSSENILDDAMNPPEYSEDGLVFYDCEVFPNLFLVNWKIEGKDKPVVRMINPTQKQIEDLVKMKLVGFNCRRYDNHMLYARLIGYTNEQLYNLSRNIVNGNGGFFGEAYNISYTDIYDFASAGNKKSLKKLEIDMAKKGLVVEHQELGLPWDEPVPEDKWTKVAEYCDNDVIATEAAFNYLSADWTARQILADIAGMTVNDTTNSLTTRIIFGRERHPQINFHYRNLAEPVKELDDETISFLKKAAPDMMSVKHGNDSILPYFPGYKYERGTSTYRDEVVGEGGYVYSEPGIHCNVALLDIASMHPHSAIAEVLFGVKYTSKFKEIVDGRVDIKHKSWDDVNDILDGKLTKYIQKVKDGTLSHKQLADALKTAINSVYGLTSANFDNPFRDIRNKDNIVAKRGALFMIDLKHEVQKRGFTVAHIKTDSIKIPNATPDIIKFVMDFGKRYGYTFEHEATYDRMCLVNDAVYIAKYASQEKCMELYGYIPDKNQDEANKWTATGTQFQVPYVFKTLFSKEPIIFDDLCETKSVSTYIYLDMNERLPDISNAEKELSNAESQFKKGTMSDRTFEDRVSRLAPIIETGHDYRFVGKVGLFCPVESGVGGGLLMREKDGKYYAVTGSKGYRWMEADMVKKLGLEDRIDKSYYKNLADEAIRSIENYGDFSIFVSDDLPFH